MGMTPAGEEWELFQDTNLPNTRLCSSAAHQSNLFFVFNNYVLKLQCGMNGIYYSVQEESIYLSFAQSVKAFLSPVNNLLV